MSTGSSKHDKEVEAREIETLKRLLSTAPQPKPKKDASASPKKRGRPKKEPINADR